jgi:hypothetical protein
MRTDPQWNLERRQPETGPRTIEWQEPPTLRKLEQAHQVWRRAVADYDEAQRLCYGATVCKAYWERVNDTRAYYNDMRAREFDAHQDRPWTDNPGPG